MTQAETCLQKLKGSERVSWEADPCHLDPQMQAPLPSLTVVLRQVLNDSDCGLELFLAVRFRDFFLGAHLQLL